MYCYVGSRKSINKLSGVKIFILLPTTANHLDHDPSRNNTAFVVLNSTSKCPNSQHAFSFAKSKLDDPLNADIVTGADNGQVGEKVLTIRSTRC